MTAIRLGLAACAAAASAVALTACGSGGTTASATTSAPAPATTAAPATTSATTSATTAPATTTPPTTAPATTAAPTSTTGGSTASPVLLIRGASGASNYDGRRPATIYFSGDSTNIVGQLTWTNWGPTTAVGHGTWSEDNCTPSCASGTITAVPATITLSGVSAGHFTSMTEHAGTLDRTYSYPSNWPLQAH